MSAARGSRLPRLSFDHRLLLMALMTGLPGSGVALALLWSGDFTPKVQWTLTALILCLWLGFAFSLRQRAVMPLQTLANLLSALRESDFSIRARGSRRDDSLGEVTLEVNELAETLREQRLGALEATNILNKMMAEIDVAVFAFDGEERLRLVNRAGEKLLAQPAERLAGRRAGELGLAECLGERQARILDIAFPGAAGRWEVRQNAFRQGGLPMQMLVLTDVSRALRQEEHQAWQKLIRVLGHELNNSLAPIRSIAGSLESLLARRPLPADWDEDMRRGLAVIASRAGALSRFMEGYSRMARLPPPRLQSLDVGGLVRRAAGLETRLSVRVHAGPELTIQGDGDQIEQLLINLVRNGADAALETGGSVRLMWARSVAHLELLVQDEGPGLSNTSNLFVPFFTTKPGGSGIGLVLSRQIAEAHGGSLTVENRRDGHGCEARLRLPL
jgi:nitrogen fixation/metabolism regulation signal transduction histidine kinase